MLPDHGTVVMTPSQNKDVANRPLVVVVVVVVVGGGGGGGVVVVVMVMNGVVGKTWMKGMTT